MLLRNNQYEGNLIYPTSYIQKSRNIVRDFSIQLFRARFELDSSYILGILAFKIIEEIFHTVEKTGFFWAMLAGAFTHFFF